MTHHPLLDELALAGMKMGLGRVRGFLASIGDPHLRYPVLHVAGTNGKGSVCRMAGAMLEAEGYRVGVTTSPHLQHINERFRVGATPVDDARLDRLLREVAGARDAWAAVEVGPTEAHPLTWFEFSVAAAFLLFAQEEVDVAVVEVGMGGRLDATNVCQPVATAIVTIGLDHCDQLGADHASIAGEKAGILKPGVPAVIGALPREALAVVRTVAAERRVPLRVYGEDFDTVGSPDAFRFRGTGGDVDDLALVLEGDHQVHNAAVAVELVRGLAPPVAVSADAVRAGLARAHNPGRLERLAPDLLVDGAHNADGAGVLANYLARAAWDRPRTLLLGAGTDKDVRAVAAALAPYVDRILTTAGAHPKARTPYDVARELEGLGTPVVPAGPLADALVAARNGRDLVIVAGSLYLVGEVRDRVGAGLA